MLYWGMFTAGFMFGVFFTLYVFLRKETNQKVFNRSEKGSLGVVKRNSWDIFENITKINYGNFGQQIKISEPQVDEG